MVEPQLPILATRYQLSKDECGNNTKRTAHSHQEQHGVNNSFYRSQGDLAGIWGCPPALPSPVLTWHKALEVPCMLCNCISVPGTGLYARISLSLTMHPDLSIDQKLCLFISNENSNYSTKLF